MFVNKARKMILYFFLCGPGTVVGIATDYGLDGPGIESRWERDFPYLSRPALRPTQLPVQWVPGLSRGKLRPGRDADPSPPSSAEVKNTGRFVMFSVITNIYNKKTKGPILMEFFTATGKLKKFFLTTRDVRCVRHG